MQRIDATFPSEYLDEIMNLVLDLRVPCQLTASEVRYADGKIVRAQQYRGTKYRTRWELRARLEVVVSDKEAESVLGVIVNRLDEKRADDAAVLVSEVDDALRVRTGRRGEFAF
jgi:nitrogen regulatory protein P-II 1